MSSIIPAIPNPGLQALTAPTAQTSGASPAEAADAPAPGIGDAAATESAADGGDRVDLSREARIELWRAFSKEHFTKIIAATSEYKETGDVEAYRARRGPLDAEYKAFEETYGTRPKTDTELAIDARMAKHDALHRKKAELFAQISRYSEISSAQAEKMPDFAIIKDHMGKQVGRIRQDGSAIIDFAGMGIFGGGENYQRIMKETSAAENPALALFEALLKGLQRGSGSIELTGIDYKPWKDPFEKEKKALRLQISEIRAELSRL